MARVRSDSALRWMLLVCLCVAAAQQALAQGTEAGQTATTDTAAATEPVKPGAEQPDAAGAVTAATGGKQPAAVDAAAGTEDGTATPAKAKDPAADLALATAGGDQQGPKQEPAKVEPVIGAHRRSCNAQPLAGWAYCPS